MQSSSNVNASSGLGSEKTFNECLGVRIASRVEYCMLHSEVSQVSILISAYDRWATNELHLFTNGMRLATVSAALQVETIFQISAISNALPGRANEKVIIAFSSATDKSVNQ